MWEINTLHALRFRRRVGVLAVEGLSTWEDLFMSLNINICRPQADADADAAGCALAVASKMSLLEANKYIYLGKSQGIDTVV